MMMESHQDHDQNDDRAEGDPYFGLCHEYTIYILEQGKKFGTFKYICLS